MGKERECQQNDSLAAPADTLPFLALSLHCRPAPPTLALASEERHTASFPSTPCPRKKTQFPYDTIFFGGGEGGEGKSPAAA